MNKKIPSISIHDIEVEDYIKQLANVERQISAYKNIVRIGVSNTVKKQFKLNGDCFQVFDKRAGGILFKDWEWELISNSCMLKELFGLKEGGKLKYCIETDEGKMLRGADTYYYFLTNKGKGEKVNIDMVKVWAQNNVIFFKKILNCLQTIDLDNVLEKRLILGVLDNLRNVSLIMLNVNIINESKKDNSLLSLTLQDKKNIKIWSELCQKVTNNITQICLSDEIKDSLLENIENNIINMISYFIENIQDISLNYKTIDLDKSFRTYREIDNYIENYIALNYAIQEIKNQNPNILNRRINFIGATYGGLELPFIANEILNNEISMSAIFLQSKYKDRQPADYLNGKLNIYGFRPESEFNILGDDNILTAKTLQSIVNLLFTNDIEVNNIAVVRYPSINRVEQMIGENSALDLSKVFTYICGLVFSSPYTKIKSNNAENYLDELGIFNKDRRRLLEYLYKNGKYKDNSEVAEIQKLYERG